MRTHTFLLFGLWVLTAGCGSQTGTTENPVTDPIPTPAITPPANSDYKLSLYSKVSANTTVNIPTCKGCVSADYLNDGIRSGMDTRGFIWRPNPSDTNNSIVSMEWNSQVQISTIQLYDVPLIGHQITGGFVRFFNSKTPETAFSDAEFNALPDDGKTPTEITGPGSPVTKMEVHITGHIPTVSNSATSQAGLSEIVVNGHRVEEKIAESNLMPHAHMTKAASTYLENIADSEHFMNGPYRPSLVKDLLSDGSGNTSTAWVCDHCGASATLDFEFDRTYTISKLKIFDRMFGTLSQQRDNNIQINDTTRFRWGTVQFVDAGKQVDFKKAASDPFAEVDVAKILGSAIKSKTIRIFFSSDPLGTPTGNYTGISNIEVTGSYSP